MLLFVLLTVLSVNWSSFKYAGVYGSRNLLGYYEEDIIALPKTEIYSTKMTVSKCVVVCGQELKHYRIALKGEWCKCSVAWTKTSVSLSTSCEQPVPCPGDFTEICGCGNQMAYYNAEFIGQCKLSFFLGKHIKAGSQSTITMQLYGDNGECFEVNFKGDTIGKIKGVSSNCFDLGPIRSIRIGNIGPSDALQIDKVVIDAPSNPQTFPNIPVAKYAFLYNNWIGTESTPTGPVGSPYQVVDIFPDGTEGVKYSYPEINGGLFYKNVSKAENKVLRCTLNDLPTGCGGNENSTYVKFEGYYYKRITDLPHLIINDRKGCNNPPPPDWENVTTNFKASGNGEEMSVPKNTNANYTCKTGKFLSTGTRVLTIQCNVAGYWVSTYGFNQLCVLNCDKQGPDVPEGATSNRTNSLAYGTIFQYACSTNYVFGGTLKSILSVACQSNGKWSMSNIPPCIPFPKNLPRPVITSKLRPMSTYHGQLHLDHLEKNGTTFTIRSVN